VTFTFSNKRLCERWLDNLFMVLYEDLRIYTFWRTESAHYRTQQMPYRKSGTEWELLGDLSLRLWHEVKKMLMIYKTTLILKVTMCRMRQRKPTKNAWITSFQPRHG
jgi:hypothetical protein